MALPLGHGIRLGICGSGAQTKRDIQATFDPGLAKKDK